MATDSILAAREVGEGLPVLIIHGWELDGTSEQLDFEPIFDKIPGFRRIYVDLPGMGKTPANGVRNLDDIYIRLQQFIDTRMGDSRFLLVGSSCGVYLARALTQRYVDQVDALLLRVPLIEPKDSARDIDPFEPLVADETVISSMSSEDKALLGKILVQTPAYIEKLRPKYKEAYQRASLAADQEVLKPIREDPQRYSLSIELDKQQPKLLAPTLIVPGRQDDVVGYRDGLRLLELYPRSTFAVLDRSRHDLPVDDNGVFETLVRDWLMRVKEWQDTRGHIS